MHIMPPRLRPEHRLQWTAAPRTALVILKPDDPKVNESFRELTSWIKDEFPDLNIVVEPVIWEKYRKEYPFLITAPSGCEFQEFSRVVDFVVTLGGDGTILHVSSLFKKAVPPILSFSLGSLGFLVPFGFNHHKPAIRIVMNGLVPLTLRMRLACSFWRAGNAEPDAFEDGIDQLQAMNDITLHRGRSPHLTSIECYVGADRLTDALGDGLIVATPTGSTAYSLSSGGSIVHPAVQSILLTPICPRSLSFRPVLLPPNEVVRLKLSPNSRGTADVSVDGLHLNFDKGDILEVKMSAYPIPSIGRRDGGGYWVRDINQSLHWNQTFQNTSVLHQSTAWNTEWSM
ncbi:ATP-NAD kinase-like domain-containing protein [Polychytrium aggregatum]|uniref:ATP-NAD kinase-like domain-containing protein n=1 Tax=Polychytrium aggregatum TaxID=110093 RepID=UPI0022FE72EF|nr:ATP-NAD kinase-like domain-containing protein [Polychytrium aggregatum]KAI9203297.1 ATP-NAD kinase-like domain-containing protein [Polychytrium aggregatum]